MIWYIYYVEVSIYIFSISKETGEAGVVRCMFVRSPAINELVQFREAEVGLMSFVVDMMMT